MTHAQFGKYEILEELGRGGFGTVYRALDTTLKREVALKMLNPALLHEAGWLARFQREAQVIAALDHPRIVTVYEIAGADNRAFIAMKLLRGPSLDRVLTERGALPWDEARRIALEVAEALTYAHAQGVLHRDLKPANIVLDAATGAVLTDFGFARLMGDTSLSLSTSGGLVGTPHYIAPELWQNQPAAPASDLYALGCIIHEVVLGRKAFPGDTSPAVMMAHFQPLALPATWPEGTPPDLDTVLRRTLAQQPGERYPTVAAFGQVLAGLQVDPWAAPYAALEAATAAGDWQRALHLAEPLHAQAPDYRAVAHLREQARAEIARADLIAQWRAQTGAALQAGQLPAARAAAEQWLRLAPGDPGAEAALAQAAPRPASVVEPRAPRQDADRPPLRTPTAPVLPVAAEPDSLPGSRPAAVRRTKPPAWLWGAAAVAVIACLAVVMGVGYLLSSRRAARPPDPILGATPAPTSVATAISTAKPTSTSTPTPAPTQQLPVAAGTAHPQWAEAIAPDNAARVTQLARWGKGTLNAIAYSPDGALLAVASSLGIYLYDATTLQELHWIKTDAWISSVVFAPDGQTLASGSWDKTECGCGGCATACCCGRWNGIQVGWRAWPSRRTGRRSFPGPGIARCGCGGCAMARCCASWKGIRTR